MTPFTIFLDVVAGFAGVATGLVILAVTAACLVAAYGAVAQYIPRKH